MSGNIRPGDRIEYRDAHGVWHPSVARSAPHLNTHDVKRGTKPWMVVRIDHGASTVNWPNADVRHLEPRRAAPRLLARIELQW